MFCHANRLDTLQRRKNFFKIFLTRFPNGDSHEAVQKRIFLTIVLMAIIAVIAWVIFFKHKIDTTENEEQTSTETTRVGKSPLSGEQQNNLKQVLTQAKMGQMEQRIAELEKRLDDARQNSDTDETGRPSKGFGAIFDKQRSRQQEIRQEREETIGRIFASNKHDYEWETSTQQQVRKLLESESFSSSAIVDMDCRYNLCKLTFSHIDQESRDTFGEEFGLKAPPHSYIWGRPFQDEKRGYGTLLYLARKGYTVFQ